MVMYNEFLKKDIKKIVYRMIKEYPKDFKLRYRIINKIQQLKEKLAIQWIFIRMNYIINKSKGKRQYTLEEIDNIVKQKDLTNLKTIKKYINDGMDLIEKNNSII